MNHLTLRCLCYCDKKKYIDKGEKIEKPGRKPKNTNSENSPFIDGDSKKSPSEALSLNQSVNHTFVPEAHTYSSNTMDTQFKCKCYNQKQTSDSYSLTGNQENVLSGATRNFFPRNLNIHYNNKNYTITDFNFTLDGSQNKSFCKLSNLVSNACNEIPANKSFPDTNYRSHCGSYNTASKNICVSNNEPEKLSFSNFATFDDSEYDTSYNPNDITEEPLLTSKHSNHLYRERKNSYNLPFIDDDGTEMLVSGTVTRSPVTNKDIIMLEAPASTGDTQLQHMYVRSTPNLTNQQDQEAQGPYYYESDVSKGSVDQDHLPSSSASSSDNQSELIMEHEGYDGSCEVTSGSITRATRSLVSDKDIIVLEAPASTGDTQLQHTYVRSVRNLSNRQDQEEQGPYYYESDISNGSKDQDYLPSSSSSSENQSEFIMEHEDFDGSCEVTSSFFSEIKSTEKGKNCINKIKSQEGCEDEEEMNKENLKVENIYTENKGILEDNMDSKRIRERDFCFYCESYILNFSRHMTRNHLAEPEVQLAISHPKNSLKRKTAFSDLRKKGNYITNSQSTFKPVKKCRFSNKYDYLPCSKCLGFYSKKQLWRHVKKCNNIASTNNAQVEAQNFLVRHVKVDNNLVTKVFPRMKPDKVSLIAKKDTLICMFGAQYLKTHREEHFATVVSRKMRELAKLLIEITKLKSNIKSLDQALKPQYYDTLAHAAKIVARYNNETGQFDAPTYAMNIATSIKQCCSIALLHSCKTEATSNTASIQSDLKALSQIITENWKFDISSQAADDLNVKKWNKVTIVPLATDLKLFKDYLHKVSKQASDNLKQSQENINIEAFNDLVESIFCRVLLLNRRRPGELQRLKLNEYIENCTNSNKYEEFDKILSATEQILVNKLKRIVIRGKRGRGVPVLFSTEVQDNISQIMSVRSIYIQKDNNLLFVKAGGVTVCGYKILEKYAKACGAKNYRALTSTRLRKHLATMTQLFTMTESELEQLATFMGHTLSVHKENYRLPNDVYQTAKISKLLLLMEDGKANKYQGKALDEIDLELEEEINGEEIDNEEVVEFQLEEERVPKNDNEKLPPPSKEIVYSTGAKKKRILVPWTTEQKNIVIKYFKHHIKNKKPPKRAECDELKNKFSTLLCNKDWLKIKVFVQNKYSKK